MQPNFLFERVHHQGCSSFTIERYLLGLGDFVNVCDQFFSITMSWTRRWHDLATMTPVMEVGYVSLRAGIYRTDWYQMRYLTSPACGRQQPSESSESSESSSHAIP